MEKTWVITIRETAIPNIALIVNSFQDEGLTVLNTLPFGVIIGSASDSTATKIAGYSQVESITLEKRVVGCN